MKKILVALTAVCLLLAPAFYAYADVLIEPAIEDGATTGVPVLQDDPEPQDADGLDEGPNIEDLIITIVAVLIIVTTLVLTTLRRNKRL